MLTEFDKNHFYTGENQKRKIIKQGKHLRLTINSENGDVFAYIDEFKGQVKGELWGIKPEHLKRARTIVENGIEFTEIELDGLFTYYSDKTINIITETFDWDKYKGLKHHDDISFTDISCKPILDDLISIQHWLALSSKKEMCVEFKDGTRVICKLECK